MSDKNGKVCPFCKESVKIDAVLCKHCHSKLENTPPPHDGTCPFCKEDINKEAIKCKHCQSRLDLGSDEKQCHCQPNIESSINQSILRRLGLKGDAGKWMCDDTGVMWCADENGTFTPCGSCIPFPLARIRFTRY